MGAEKPPATNGDREAVEAVTAVRRNEGDNRSENTDEQSGCRKLGIVSIATETEINLHCALRLLVCPDLA